ncbi:MAG: AAA domain-containing protein [Crocosphaera sp.]
MRDSNNWLQKLSKQFKEHLKNYDSQRSSFIRTELMLYGLQAYFPQYSIRKAHLLMQGYREPGISDYQWQIIKHLRHLASEFRSSISWEIALRNYDDLATNNNSILGFEIDYENNNIRLTNDMFTNRYEVYENVLNRKLEFDKRKYNPAPKGDYQFKINSEEIRLVKIDESIANIGIQYQNNIPSINLSRNRQAIRIPLKELVEKGRKLEPVLGYDAGEIIEKSRYWDIKQNKETDEIYINGESHILGPTGSGKSTLIESLITVLIEQNKRITIATNSVGEVQDWLEFAKKIEIEAVPIIGNSERHKHLSRLNQAIMFDDKYQSFTHPGFKWLSQCCPLFALATPSIAQSITNKRNKKPCFNQLEEIKKESHQNNQEDEQKKKKRQKTKYDCPLVGVCPQHITAQELEEAQLIVGTLPGFIHKKVSSHTLKENITILEYLALTTDLFIVDEVDLAQPKLDELFYPIVTLASFKRMQDTWSRNEFYQHINSVLEGEIVVLENYKDSYLEESELWKLLACKAIGDMMYSLRDIATTHEGKKPTQEIEKLLKQCATEGRLFAAWSLFDSLAEHLSGKIKIRLEEKIRKPTANKYEKSYQRYREIFKRIQDNLTEPSLTDLQPKDRKIVSQLSSIAAILLNTPSSKIPHPKCVEFIKETKWDTELNKLESDVEKVINNLAILLQLSIYAAQGLGALGKHISARTSSNSELQSNLPLIPPVDFEKLLPASPVGAVTSAQYQNGDLKIHRGICIGRSLLSQWQEIFTVDGLTPSHLLVTSATSYSGEYKQSYTFHVQQKPSLLIEPPKEKIDKVTKQSEFFFCPVVDKNNIPVRISGSYGEQRHDNIEKMVSGLCRSFTQGEPLIDRFQKYLKDKIGSDRKNLLLITNSYAEAKTFYNCLKSSYQEKASFVVRDGDSDLWSSDINVPRSKMTEFPSQGKELLIAPIGAISRAVNLMHPDNKEEPYFGGMVILVRQHPRPDDNQIIISAVNKNAVDNIGSRSVTSIQRDARHTRDVFLAVPQIFSNLPDEIQDVDMKNPLVWTLAVNLTQLIGRSTRGGRNTVVWFTDAAFMPKTAQGNKDDDTAQTSLLLAVRELLGNAIKEGGSSGRLIETLYGPVYHPLKRLTHFINEVDL